MMSGCPIIWNVGNAIGVLFSITRGPRVIIFGLLEVMDDLAAAYIYYRRTDLMPCIFHVRLGDSLISGRKNIYYINVCSILHKCIQHKFKI